MFNTLFGLDSQQFLIGFVLYVVAGAITALATLWLYKSAEAEINQLFHLEKAKTNEPANDTPRGRNTPAARGSASPTRLGDRELQKEKPAEQELTWKEKREFIKHNTPQVVHKLTDEFFTWALIVFIVWGVAWSVVALMH